MAKSLDTPSIPDPVEDVLVGVIRGSAISPSADPVSRVPEFGLPHSSKDALKDIPVIHHAMNLFFASKMQEAEQFCEKNDPNKDSLYMTTGYAIIQCVKGMMSFEKEDILAALNHVKRGNLVAQAHRKKASSFASRATGYAPSGTARIKSMTDAERHAEFVYAETMLEKALLGIVSSGNWMIVVKEALNLRTTINLYQELLDFINEMDAEASARYDQWLKTNLTPVNSSPVTTPKPFNDSIDQHFRSGVYLGAGVSSLVLSLIPGKLASIAEVFGYKGDRRSALALLARAGGWQDDESVLWRGERGWKDGEPGVSPGEEGIRRTICDLVLAFFHTVLSGVTFDAIDITMAERLINWNLRQYPDGVFFLFAAGRLCITRSQPRRAIEHFTKAMQVQTQYRNLHHTSHWEIALATLSLWDVKASHDCWKTLQEEASTWSTAMYMYAHAVCLIELGGEEQFKEAAVLMQKVPGTCRPIAGKSVPLEKYAARKARKFEVQGGRLALPFLELAYIFLGIHHAPRSIITSKMLPAVEATLAKLKVSETAPEKYEGGKGGYWDDMCLAQFLKGVCLRFVAYPDQYAAVNHEDTVDAVQIKEAAGQAVVCFESVFANGRKIEVDQHLVYHAHYELGWLLWCQEDSVGARKQFNFVVSGKPLEINTTGGKGKYSLENFVTMRAHSAIQAMDVRGRRGSFPCVSS